MEPKLIFAPVLVQIALTVALYLRLAVVKRRARATPGFDAARAALHDDAWPDDVLKVSNNIRNQFEAPVLFYALAFVLFALSRVDAVSLGFASTFVALRVVHATIHTTSNVVKYRRRVFIAATATLFAMWVYAGAGLLA